MAQVNTVLGPIHPDEMGIAALHEHILWGPAGWEYDPDWWFSPPKVFEKCCTDLLDFKSLGGRTLVDVSGIGLGRDVELYALISKSAGVHIVACTGFWAEMGILGYFAIRDIDYHEELYVRELTQGMGQTSVKAGIIKIGTSVDEMTPLEELTFRAAARASKRTGCAVTTHGHGLRSVKEQLRVFKDERVDPSRIIIGHRSDATSLDLELDKEIAGWGAYLGYDHIGTTPAWSPMPYAMWDDIRADMVKAMIDAGHIERIILSADVNSFSLGWQRSAPVVGKHMVGDLLRFIPRLYRAGVSEEQVHMMLVENPKRVLPF
ncbi:MAG: phosphotriesterase [Dehalococcoidia bacterium]